MARQYDIFISYRREGGAQYARIVQLMLQQRGYNVFLDYDELKEGTFSDKIVRAIDNASIFIFILSKDALVRCANDGDWVRREIEMAVSKGKVIIPLNPDSSFNGIPEGVSPAVAKAAGEYQHSDISFGQLLGVTVDFMIDNRIAPVVGKRSSSEKADTDYDAAKLSLEKLDRHHRIIKRLTIATSLIIITVAVITSILLWKSNKEHNAHAEEQEALQTLRTDIDKKYSQLHLNLSSYLSERQMLAIDSLMSSMVELERGSLWISQFEFQRGWLCDITGEVCDPDERHLPSTSLNFGEIMLFLDSLSDMTGLLFGLPSADEWQLAAQGGADGKKSLYAGSDNADEVAWYKANSGGKPHRSDGQQGKSCNFIDLFDMSGNVSELCNSPFGVEGSEMLWTICGGDYNSSAEEITTTSRSGISTQAKEPTVGFRPVIRTE